MGTAATKLTVERFLEKPERLDVKQELIDGEVLEVGRGGPVHEWVKSSFIGALAAYFWQRPGRGRVLSETMYWLTEHDSPIPDASVLLSGGLDPKQKNRNTAVPDIAIEVVSSEPARDLQTKIQLYLSSGVKSVWVAYPDVSILEIHKLEGIRRLSACDNLEDGDLLPGFSVPVSTLFEGPPAS